MTNNAVTLSLEEKRFLDNLTRNMTHESFIQHIIREARKNPNRENYPSVDLGSYDDVEHGLLFGAKHHIMIDPLLSPEVSAEIILKLKNYGASIVRVTQQDNTRNVEYKIGSQNRALKLVEADASKLDEALDQRVQSGISSLIMKSMGGFKGQDGYTNLVDVMEKYLLYLREGGLLLSGVDPKAEMKKVGEGKLSYWVHTSNDCRVSPHGLYLKTAKY